MTRSAPPSSAPGPGDDPVRFERVSENQRSAMLSLLLTGRLEGGDAAVRPFLQYVRQQGMPLDNLWAVHDGRRTVGAALLVPTPGRAAMLFINPIDLPSRSRTVGRLVAAVLDTVDPGQTRLIQALPEPTQASEQQALRAGGMRRLTELIYMQAPGRLTDTPSPRYAGRPLEVRTWDDTNRPLFAQAIEDSYHDTLDCPGLRGIRETADIIAGHQATGRFVPEHWRVYLHGRRPLAVLLLAPSHQGHDFELVYLGVCPEARGHGLGQSLVDQALRAVARAGRGRLNLAVDELNAPALKLYRGAGFRPTTRRTAYIHTPANPDG